MSWKRLHTLPRAYDRAAPPGLTIYEQLLGVRRAGLETGRQRFIRERSEARWRRRPDAYTDARPLYTGEIGRLESVRFIEG